MSPQEIQLLYDFNAWANRRILGAAEKLTPEQYMRAMGSSFASVRDTVAHIYGAEWLWLWSAFKGARRPHCPMRRSSLTSIRFESSGSNTNSGCSLLLAC